MLHACLFLGICGLFFSRIDLLLCALVLLLLLLLVCLLLCLLWRVVWRGVVCFLCYIYVVFCGALWLDASWHGLPPLVLSSSPCFSHSPCLLPSGLAHTHKHTHMRVHILYSTYSHTVTNTTTEALHIKDTCHIRIHTHMHTHGYTQLHMCMRIRLCISMRIHKAYACTCIRFIYLYFII